MPNEYESLLLELLDDAAQLVCSSIGMLLYLAAFFSQGKNYRGDHEQLANCEGSWRWKRGNEMINGVVFLINVVFYGLLYVMPSFSWKSI